MMNKEKAKIRKRKKEHINKFDIRIFFIISISPNYYWNCKGK